MRKVNMVCVSHPEGYFLSYINSRAIKSARNGSSFFSEPLSPLLTDHTGLSRMEDVYQSDKSEEPA